MEPVQVRLSEELNALSVATFSTIFIFYLLSYVSWHLAVASLLLIVPFYVMAGRLRGKHSFLRELYYFGGAWKYVFPFGLYLIIGDLVRIGFPWWEEYHVYLGYVARVVLTGVLLLRYRMLYVELRGWRFSVSSVVVGVVVFVAWVGLDGRYPVFAGADAYYDLSRFDGMLFAGLLLVRLVGGVFVAAVIEELFTRSFLLRYLVDVDYERVPIGTYTPLSFVVVTLFFGFAHFQWLPALLTSALLNLLLYRERHISSCIMAHAVSNLLLLVYVVVTESWYFW